MVKRDFWLRKYLWRSRKALFFGSQASFQKIAKSWTAKSFKNTNAGKHSRPDNRRSYGDGCARG